MPLDPIEANDTESAAIKLAKVTASGKEVSYMSMVHQENVRDWSQTA